MLSKRLLCFAGCVLLTPSVALATYSIAAVDMSTQEVGGAITSCVGSLDVGIVYGSLPGVGVIHAQAQLDQRGRAKTRALELMMQGKAPKDIVAEITDPGFDPQFASRQYGLVDIMGRTAGFTGAQAQAFKRDQQGMNGAFAYSVQGNILTSQAVLDQASAAFDSPACDLAERLMRALEAGAEHGEGDSRCTGDGIPSDSAFIQVDRPGQSEPYLRLSVVDSGPESPLPMLRKQFDAWRTQHPCPMSSGMQAGAGAAAMSGRGGSSAAAGGGGTSPASAAGNGGPPAATATGAAASGAAPAGAAAASGAAPAGAAAASGATGTGGTAATARTLGASMAGTGAASSAPAAGAATNRSSGTAGTSAANPAANSLRQASTTQPEAPARSSSGCSLTPHAPHAWADWLLAAPALWLARRTRRR
ncbi:MAG TPA: DUF1028 domain-containing protein [Polyangiales bacterium]|nr:DUF1028 domain-containing protein [Polyangiales bacterium]